MQWGTICDSLPWEENNREDGLRRKVGTTHAGQMVRPDQDISRTVVKTWSGHLQDTWQDMARTFAGKLARQGQEICWTVGKTWPGHFQDSWQDMVRKFAGQNTWQYLARKHNRTRLACAASK